MRVRRNIGNYGFGERDVTHFGKGEGIPPTGHLSLASICIRNTIVIYVFCLQAPFLPGTLSIFYYIMKE